jgi:hypothetical protein
MSEPNVQMYKRQFFAIEDTVAIMIYWIRKTSRDIVS